MKSFILAATGVLVMSMLSVTVRAQAGASPADLRKMADDHYAWRNQNYPVASSDAGLHTWDDKLTDYSPSALQARRTHFKSLLEQVNAMQTDKWAKDDRIDWLLFRA